jgi:hypothetical protein
VDDVAGHAAGVEPDVHGAGRAIRICRDEVTVQPEPVEARKDLAPEPVLPDAADYVGVGPELAGVEREVRRRPAELLAGGQQVPQHFTDADDDGAGHAG